MRKIKNAAEIKHFWPILPFLVNVAGSVDPQIKKHCLDVGNSIVDHIRVKKPLDTKDREERNQVS